MQVAEPLDLPEKSLLESLQSRGLRYRREDSFKMVPSGLLTDRFLVAVPAAGVAAQSFAEIATGIGIPGNLKAMFLKYLPEADVIGYGIEGGAGGLIYKAYLEFWEKVRREVLGGSREPALLYLGFKWDARDNSRNLVARYTCYPVLDLAGLLRRIRGIYGAQVDRPSCGTGLRLAELGTRRNAAPIYLEVGEDGTARRSYDINLYKASLTLGEIEPMLLEAAARYGLPHERFAAFYSQLRKCVFGHLSGGFARDGSDFLTVYYETPPPL